MEAQLTRSDQSKYSPSLSCLRLTFPTQRYHIATGVQGSQHKSQLGKYSPSPFGQKLSFPTQRHCVRVGGGVVCGNWQMKSWHNKCMWPGWERLPQDAPSPRGLFVASSPRLSLCPLRNTQRNAHNKYPAREALTIFPQTEGPCSNKHQQTLFIPKTGNLLFPTFRHPSQSKLLHLP